jgi:hypothetical protein
LEPEAGQKYKDVQLPRKVFCLKQHFGTDSLLADNRKTTG